MNAINTGNKCFKYNIIATLHHLNRKYNPDRISYYKPYLNDVNCLIK